AAGHLGCFSHQGGNAVGERRAGQYRVDGDASACQALGQAVGYGEVGGLGHSVVDHVGRDGNAGLGGDEQDPPPAFVDHARCVVASQAHAGQHVGVVEAAPLAVGDIEEIDVIIDA